MAMVLDAGALVAVDRGDRRVNRLLEQNWMDGACTSCAAVAQVWREGARQARLALLLRGVKATPLDDRTDRRIGELLRRAGTADVVDGHVALIAQPGDRVLTSDVEDIGRLLDVRGVRTELLTV